MPFFVARPRAAFQHGVVLDAAPRYAAESREQPPHVAVPFVRSTPPGRPGRGEPAARPYRSHHRVRTINPLPYRGHLAVAASQRGDRRGARGEDRQSRCVVSPQVA